MRSSRLTAWLLLGLAIAAAPSCRTVETEPAQSTTDRAEVVRARFAEAEAAFDAKKYTQARNLFRTGPERGAGSELAADASYWIAETYFRQRRVGKAFSKFRSYVEEYPISTHLEEAESRIFEIAILYLRGKARGFLGIFPKRGVGVACLEFLLETFPRGRKAPEAQRLLAGYHYDRAKYPEALAEYRELLRRFPDSEWLPLAQYRSGMCYIERVRGPAYDRSLLERAREEFQLYIERHPEGTWVEDASDRIRNIDEALAEKSYRTGRFYERDGSLTAARLYYTDLIRVYPESPWSRAAKTALEGLKDQGGEENSDSEAE